MSLNCNDLSTAVWIYDIDNYCIHSANKAALQLWEADSLEELVTRDFEPDSSQAVQKTLLDYRRSFEKNQTVSVYWHFSPKNIPKEAFCQMSGYTFDDGRIGLLCEATPAHLTTSNGSQSSILMLSTYDSQGSFISANPPFVELMGPNINCIEQIFTSNVDYQNFLQQLQEHKKFRDDCLIHTQHGKVWFDLQASVAKDNPNNSEILIQQFSINERKLEQIYLTQQVNTDPLTGLLNRRGFKEQLEKNIREDTEFYIYYIDLDSFKMVNDSMGHAVGDLVLKTLSARLKSDFFKEAITCRFGGDEFILVVNKHTTSLSQGKIANELLKLTSLPYTDIKGAPLSVSASVGSANFPRDGDDLDKLLLRADAAMYMAKSQGKKRGVRYTKGMEESLQRSSLVARHLFLAIENDELSLHYQPIYDTSTNQIYSFEALLRWHNPTLGSVSPDETIGIAESTGIIVDIENWVINQAIKDLPQLRSLTASRALISINISGLHFVDPLLPHYLLGILAKHKLTASDLVIELTESALLKDINEDNSGAQHMSENGISLSIDDFGTGFSSLAYLHQIPAKVVKIDRSFTDRLIQSSATITSIHYLLKSLQMITLVEGVETREQSELLQMIGINLQQGFVLARPQPLSYYIDQAQISEQSPLL